MRRESLIWFAVILILLLSCLCAIFILVWYHKKKNPAPRERIDRSLRDSLEPDDAMKRWRSLAILWPLLCVLFSGCIVVQSLHAVQDRVVWDAAFTLLPLVFFAIGMSIRRRLLRERRYATQSTTATVVSDGRAVHSGNDHFYPEFSFQAGETTYHVTSQAGYGRRVLREGRQVTLYYAPENPRIFYVPALQRRDRRFSALMCTIGFLFPLLGLCAPLLRALVESLP